MIFTIGKTPLEPRIDKPNILDNYSVSDYLLSHKTEKLEMIENKVLLLEIIDKNIKGYPYRRFGTIDNTKQIIDGILEEVCLDEIKLAIHWFQARGINKCINFLLDCVS